jgi:hypothetical protein
MSTATQQQDALTFVKEKMRAGEMTVDQANVEMVRALRVKLVTSKMPASVRRSLNDAVKAGQLGHLKKDGLLPEAYFHPTFDYMAKGERADHARESINALRAATSAVLA